MDRLRFVCLALFLCVSAGSSVHDEYARVVEEDDEFDLDELHQQIQEEMGSSINLLDVQPVLLHGVKDASGKTFPHAHKVAGEMHIRRLAKQLIGEDKPEQRLVTDLDSQEVQAEDEVKHEMNIAESASESDKPKYVQHDVKDADKPGNEKGDEKGDDGSKAAEAESQPEKSSETVQAEHGSTENKQDKADTEKDEAEKKAEAQKAQEKEDANKNVSEKEKAEESYMAAKAKSEQAYRDLQTEEHKERNVKIQETIEKKKYDAHNKVLAAKDSAEKDEPQEGGGGAQVPREALPPIEVHGPNGRVDPSEPRRTFLVNPAETPRGFEYCKDRHTITYTTVEAPDQPASLCGKCESGFTLLPMTNLGFKMLGICYSIKGTKGMGPLPLWTRVSSLPRNSYNDRSCRYFLSIKGWKKHRNYIQQKFPSKFPTASAGKWHRVTKQHSNAKRAHATHCAVTSLASDASLGEFADRRAGRNVKARVFEGPKDARWFMVDPDEKSKNLCEPSDMKCRGDVRMPTKSEFNPHVIGEGWKYDFQELKVAKYAGCYTYNQAHPKLTCDKATQILACNQVRVFSTKKWLDRKVANNGYSIIKTVIHKGDYTIVATERPSWWRPGTAAKAVFVIDNAPFVCPFGGDTGATKCRKRWEKRAGYLALLAVNSKQIDGSFKACQRMMSEAALSLQ